MSTMRRAGIAVAAVAAAIILFVVLKDGGDEQKTSTQPATTTGQVPTQTEPENAAKPARPKATTVTVRGAKPVGGIKRLEYVKGERVRLVVRSDVADEVHVHGYDRSKDVAAGGSVRFNFPATLEGVFEIELESRHEQIAELRVEPR